MYSLFLDASKAFDRVNYVKLFNLLLERNMCPTVARFLAYMYTKQSCRINWGSFISDEFQISNGVKQGGILSPLLFNVYIDVLLIKLRSSGYGCYIGNIFTGALGYADDILLLCPTVHSLNHMLNICEQFSSDYDITFQCY